MIISRLRNEIWQEKKELAIEILFGVDSSIVGTWQYEEEDFVITLKLNKDGSFRMTDKEYYNGEWDTWVSNGEYEYEDDVLTFYEDRETYSFSVISVTSKKLKVDIEGDIFTLSKI